MSSASKNALLLRLGAADLERLCLQPVDLPPRKHLERQGRPSQNVYFLDEGIASVVAGPAPHGRPVEVAMTGREGLVGLSAILSGPRAPHDTLMLVAGKGWRAPTEAVVAAFHASEALRLCILDYMHALLSQLSATAAANARNTIEERLARWLLLAQDRTGCNVLAVTHNVVAQMLSVRRAGVSVALKRMETRGLIVIRRGGIQIVDRDGLVTQSRGAYTRADENMGQRAV